MNNKVISDENASMSLSRSWCGTTAFRSLPSHDFKVQDINVVEIVFSIPTSEYVHFGAPYNVGRMVESRRWCTSASGTLIPSHRNWIERVKVLKSSIFATLTSKYNNS